MPVEVTTKTGGAEFDGTAGSGLFAPGNLGNARNRVIVRWISFHTSSTIGTWTLTVKDNATPRNTVSVLLAGTSTTFVVSGGADGYCSLPAVDGESYVIEFTTTTIAGDSILTIDYDIVQGFST
jgi:hypothetical protein